MLGRPRQDSPCRWRWDLGAGDGGRLAGENRAWAGHKHREHWAYLSLCNRGLRSPWLGKSGHGSAGFSPLGLAQAAAGVCQAGVSSEDRAGEGSASKLTWLLAGFHSLGAVVPSSLPNWSPPFPASWASSLRACFGTCKQRRRKGALASRWKSHPSLCPCGSEPAAERGCSCTCAHTCAHNTHPSTLVIRQGYRSPGEGTGSRRSPERA